jgi:hypothetical protein
MFEQNNNGRNNSNHRKVFTSSFIDVITVEHFVYFDSTRLSDFGSQHFIWNYYTEATLLEFCLTLKAGKTLASSSLHFPTRVLRPTCTENRFYKTNQNCKL